VVVVNEFIQDGHLAYLNRVKLETAGSEPNADVLGGTTSRPKAIQSVWDASNETTVDSSDTALKFSPMGGLCLKSLPDLVGPMPDRTWQDEWVALSLRFYATVTNEEVEEAMFTTGKYSISAESRKRAKAVAELVSEGWGEHEAMLVQLLLRRRQPLARSIIERDSSYAASLYAFSQALYRMATQQSLRQSRRARTMPPMYKHQIGIYSLAESDPQWATILTPNENNFYGFLSTAATEVNCELESFVEEGFAQRVTTPQGTSYECQDSPVVCFEIEGPDSEGCLHAPVMLPGRTSAIFPPNCFFTLKSILENGFRAPNNVWVKRQLLVVTATYHLYSFAAGGPSPGVPSGKLSSKLPAGEPSSGPSALASNWSKPLELVERWSVFEQLLESTPVVSEDAGEKMLTDLRYFEFGDHEDFLTGFDGKMTRSMRQEFEDNDGGRWLAEYLYVVEHAAIGVPDASRNHPERMAADSAFKRIHTSLEAIRRRDQGNEGRRLDFFCQCAEAQKAKLTPAEVVAARLYTGPVYQPINAALRAGVVDLWATTIACLYQAVLKLSFLSKPTRVYRGVKEHERQLPQAFLDRSEGEFAGGVERAFMSTTTDPAVAVSYAGDGPGSIFIMDFGMASRGASLRFLSQFPHEDELLFPPKTMLECKEHVQRGNKRLIDVSPTVSTARPDTRGINRPEDMPLRAEPAGLSHA